MVGTVGVSEGDSGGGEGDSEGDSEGASEGEPVCHPSQVDTVKRMCIKKLPKILVFQLKRFDYDWER